ILSVRRPEGRTRSTVRTIHSASRFEETPPELVVERTEAGYVRRGTEADFVGAEVREAVCTFVAGSSETAKAMTAIVGALAWVSAGGSALGRGVRGLVTAGTVLRGGTGKKGRPYLYWSPRIHSPQTTPPGWGESNSGSEEVVIP